jgi:glycosyltransferase involved in cell wall biosynthesis
MPVLHACTIASNNYLAMARVFAESYLEHHPGARVFVCVVDEPATAVSYARLPFTVIFARDLGITAFRNMAFRYDVMELNTAVKPFLLSYLRDRFGLDSVLYFDPDIVVMDRLSGLEDRLAEASMLLTPHITQPLEDNRSPSERLIRQVGVYNLGFLGIRLGATTKPFLEWWQRRLHRQCLNDPSNGLFVDQAWMDLAPAFLDRVEVLRDPIYNLAYWNLAHRFPRFEGGHWMLDGRRLGFFHFSGFDIDDIESISRHQNRLKLADREELRPLFEDYRGRLIDRGFLSSRDLRYSYGTFEGMPLPIPRYLRRALLRVDPDGRRWPDPFATDVEDSFLDWLEETDHHSLGTLPRAALCLWEERWDLRLAFPDVTGSDLPAFVRWLQRGGGVEGGLWPSLVEKAQSAKRSAASRTTAKVAPRTWIPPASTSTGVFELQHPGQSLAWLNQPVSGPGQEMPRLTAAALLLHELRADVQAAYPDPRGDDRAAYAHWFVFYGGPESGLDRRLIAPVARTLPFRQRLKYQFMERLRRRSRAVEGRAHAAGARREAAGPPSARVGAARPGVNLAGYFDMDTGVGQAARGSLAALEFAGVAVARVQLDHTVLDGIPPEHRVGAPYAFSLVHANADESRRALAELPAAAATGSFKAGYWFWELSHFPLGFSDRFLYFDEIWAPSRFCAESFQTIASVPVRHVPPCVLPPKARPVDRATLGLDRDRFYFFFSFDVASVPERKNPLAAVEALSRLARSSSRPVGLVLKIMRAERNPAMVQRLRALSRGLPVVLLVERTSRSELESLLSTCDACLHLHRSEGLGLLPIESMYLGKPVVATGYGGVTDYLDESTGFPVSFDIRRLEAAHGPYPGGAVWADPRIEDAVEKMRAVVENPGLAGARAARARERVLALYSVEAASQRFAAEVKRILGAVTVPGPAAWVEAPAAEPLKPVGQSSS